MKRLLILLSMGTCMFCYGGNNSTPQKAPEKSPRIVHEPDQTDIFAIPLDEDEQDQDEELEEFEHYHHH